MLTLLGNLPGMAYRRCNDHEWTMQFVSDGCAELTGYRCADLVGNATTSYGSLVSALDRDTIRQEVQRAITERRPFQVIYRICTGNGQKKWVSEHGCGVFSEDGKLRALEGYIFDITETKELEEKLRASERLKHIGEAASTIIHDLKNPMQVVMGHVELLRTERPLMELDLHCDIIQKQVDRMLSMCHELLDYSRGGVSLNLTPTNLCDLLTQLVETYKPSFQMAGMKLSYADRREPSADVEVTLDQDRIWRVIMNLLTNAREALADGGEIRLRSWIGPEQVRIEVQDNGPGIPEQIREKLFDPFVTHGKSGGTGLGLAIAGKIVEAHRGTITCTSSRGAGTTFTITLPRHNIAGAEEHARAEVGRKV